MQSEQVNELFAALATAQGQIANPKRNKKVKVKTRTGGEYEFEYADQAAIIDAIKKPLSDNGLGYTQYVEQIEEKYRLVTILGHKSGQWISAINPLFVSRDTPPSSQDFGSALTFMRRYALSALIGIAADDDDDANMADGNTAKFTPRTPASAPAIKPPSKAAEALIGIAASTPVINSETPLPVGDVVQPGPVEEMSGQAWRRFAEKAIAHAREGKGFSPEQQQKMSLMKVQAPKTWQKMADAIADAQMTKPSEAPKAQPQPNPGDDPDAYRIWLIDQMSRIEKKKDLTDFFDIQRPLWQPCFPPDIEDWEGLFKERIGELS